MPTKQILNLGSGGVAYDTPKSLLPENVFTDVRNVRFKNQSVGTITGEALYATLSNAPNYGFAWRRPEGFYNIFLRDDSYVLVNATAARDTTLGFTWSIARIETTSTCSSLPNWLCAEFTDLLVDNVINTYSEAQLILSQGIYSDSSEIPSSGTYSLRQWQTTTFNGGYAIVINDGSRTPKYIDYNSDILALTFTDIPGWNYVSGKTVSTKVIRPLGYSLVAANLTTTTTATGAVSYAPSSVRISDPAAPGGFPSTWMPSTLTTTADEFDLSTTSPILDMAELRGSLFIYAEDSISMLTINTGITRVQPYSTSFGILNTDCVVEFEGNHFVVDRNDVYTHNGSGNITSIATDFVREYLFDNLSYANQNKVFVKKDSYNREIWICYPKGENLTCNEALIYNYRNKVWSVRDLPNITSAFNAINVEPYLEIPQKNTMIMLTGKEYTFETDSNYNMYNISTDEFSPINSYLTKEKLNSGDLFDSNQINSLSLVFDKVSDNSPITVKVSGENTINIEPDWDNPRNVFVFEADNPRSQGYKVDPRVSGRFLSYSIESDGPWRLALIGIDFAPKDKR
jgi:hypothetical protein